MIVCMCPLCLCVLCVGGGGENVCMSPLCLCVLVYHCMFASTLFTVGAASNEGSRLSMIQTFQSIWSSEGLRGMYRGLLPNFLKVAPAVSVAYVMYEQIKRVLGVPTVK